MKKLIYFAGVLSGLLIGTIVGLWLHANGLLDFVVLIFAFVGLAVLAACMIAVLVDMRNDKRKASRTPTPIPWDKRIELY